MDPESDALTEDLKQVVNKKVKGATAARADLFYIYLALSHGKRAVFASKSPIYVEVEDEQ